MGTLRPIWLLALALAAPAAAKSFETRLVSLPKAEVAAAAPMAAARALTVASQAAGAAVPAAPAQAAWIGGFDKGAQIARRVDLETRSWAPLRLSGEDGENDGDDGPGEGWARGPLVQGVDESLDSIKMQLQHPVNRLYPIALHEEADSAEALSASVESILKRQFDGLPEKDLVPVSVRMKTAFFIERLRRDLKPQPGEELDGYRQRVVAELDRTSGLVSAAGDFEALRKEGLFRGPQAESRAAASSSRYPLAALGFLIAAIACWVAGLPLYPWPSLCAGITLGCVLLWMAQCSGGR